MKAILQERYGSAETLTFGEAPNPKVGERDVLVRVHASPVVKGNIQFRTGEFPAIVWLPVRLMLGLFRPRHQVPGTVFAGQVEAVGAAVTRFAIGDNVFGANLHGAHAELIVVRDDALVAKMPSGVSYSDAAAVPYGGITSLIFLRDLAKVQPSDRVLVLGASGGIGRFAVQIAKHLGAEVTGVCSQQKHELVRSLGAGHLIDYKSEDFTQNGQRYDVIFDTAGSSSFGSARASLTPGGRYLCVDPSFRLFLWMLRTSFLGMHKARYAIAHGSSAELEDVGELLENGAIWPVVAQLLPLERAVDAHKLVEGGRLRGSVVLQIEVDPMSRTNIRSV